MKSKSIRVALSLTVLLGVFLLIMSCGTGPQNTQNTNQANQERTANAVNTMVIDYDAACNSTDIDARVKAVQAKIDQELERDDELKEGRVKIKVRKVGTKYLELLVEGYVGGEDELDDLSHIIKKFMNKEKKCVLSVSFVQTGTIASDASPSLNEPVRWSACEWPYIACPGGECAKSCPRLTPDPNDGNANTNSNGNTLPNVNTRKGNYQ